MAAKAKKPKSNKDRFLDRVEGVLNRMANPGSWWYVLTGLGFIFLPPFMAADSDIGREVAPGFYSAMAQLIPVLLVAFILETSYLFQGGSGRLRESGWLMFTLYLGALVAEGTALYALAAETSTPFLFFATVSNTVWIAIVFGGLVLFRFRHER